MGMSAYAMCVVCKRVIGPLESAPVPSDCAAVNAHDLGWAKIDGKWHCAQHNPENAARTFQFSMWELIPPPPKISPAARMMLYGASYTTNGIQWVNR